MNTLARDPPPTRHAVEDTLPLLTRPGGPQKPAAMAPERDAHVPPATRPPIFRPLMMSTLLGLPSAEQRRQALHKALRAIGFDALNIMLAESMDSVLVPVSTLGALPDTSWCDLYLRSKHYEVDPRLHDVSGSGLPCLWDIDSLRADTLQGLPCERAERFLRDLCSTGTRSGLLFALRGGSGSGRSLVGLRSRHEGLDWMTDALVGQALMLAVFAVEHCADIAPDSSEEPDAGALSELQHGILHCLRLGMGDKVIADRLGLTTYNVDYHLRKLRQRFGVRNRVQLVQAAQCAMLM